MGGVNKYASLIFLQRPNALLRMVRGIHDIILLWGDYHEQRDRLVCCRILRRITRLGGERWNGYSSRKSI